MIQVTNLNSSDDMPDEWELLSKLYTHDPSDGNVDSNGDGYTNLEHFLNGIIY